MIAESTPILSVSSGVIGGGGGGATVPLLTTDFTPFTASPRFGRGLGRIIGELSGDRCHTLGDSTVTPCMPATAVSTLALMSASLGPHAARTTPMAMAVATAARIW